MKRKIAKDDALRKGRFSAPNPKAESNRRKAHFHSLPLAVLHTLWRWIVFEEAVNILPLVCKLWAGSFRSPDRETWGCSRKMSLNKFATSRGKGYRLKVVVNIQIPKLKIHRHRTLRLGISPQSIHALGVYDMRNIVKHLETLKEGVTLSEFNWEIQSLFVTDPSPDCLSAAHLSLFPNLTSLTLVRAAWEKRGKRETFVLPASLTRFELGSSEPRLHFEVRNVSLELNKNLKVLRISGECFSCALGIPPHAFDPVTFEAIDDGRLKVLGFDNRVEGLEELSVGFCAECLDSQQLQAAGRERERERERERKLRGEETGDEFEFEFEERIWAYIPRLKYLSVMSLEHDQDGRWTERRKRFARERPKKIPLPMGRLPRIYTPILPRTHCALERVEWNRFSFYEWDAWDPCFETEGSKILRESSSEIPTLSCVRFHHCKWSIRQTFAGWNRRHFCVPGGKAWLARVEARTEELPWIGDSVLSKTADTGATAKPPLLLYSDNSSCAYLEGFKRCFARVIKI